MESLNENNKRLFIGSFYAKNKNKGKSFTVIHFSDQKVPKSTIYDIISRVDNEESLERCHGSGRKPKVSKKIIDKFIEENVGTVSKSYKFLGKGLKVHRKTAKSYLNSYEVIKRKRIEAPKSDDNQKIRQKVRLSKLRRGLFKPSSSTEIIEDDESYFTLNGTDGYGNDSYFSHFALETPEEVKFKFKKKFDKKVLVWIAISSRGLSEPFIAERQGFAINANIYINECVKKRLIKFINKRHSDGNYLFWPDLASAHYAKDTIETFDQKPNLAFVRYFTSISVVDLLEE
jgi:hypothetical protein